MIYILIRGMGLERDALLWYSPNCFHPFVKVWHSLVVVYCYYLHKHLHVLFFTLFYNLSDDIFLLCSIECTPINQWSLVIHSPCNFKPITYSSIPLEGRSAVPVWEPVGVVKTSNATMKMSTSNKINMTLIHLHWTTSTNGILLSLRHFETSPGLVKTKNSWSFSLLKTTLVADMLLFDEKTIVLGKKHLGIYMLFHAFWRINDITLKQHSHIHRQSAPVSFHFLHFHCIL